MPPRRRVSAPVNRVYDCGPTLHQTKFKSPPRTAKKKAATYGKKTSVRIPRPKVDNTLTQMDYVRIREPPDLGREDEDAHADAHGQSNYEEVAEKRKKRRKTTGDEPSATPLYHQSTMTQFARSFSSAYEEEEAPDVDDPPSSSQPPIPPQSSLKRSSVAAGKENVPPPAKSPAREQEISGKKKSQLSEAALPPRGSIPPPQTPPRIKAREIPSSQSPATPLSSHSLHSLANRTPLQERKIKAPLFRNDQQKSSTEKAGAGNHPPSVPLFANIRRTAQVSPKKLLELEIDETFDTATEIGQITRVPSSPAKARSSPAKTVRFAVPEEEEVAGHASPLVKKEAAPVTVSSSSGTQKLQIEIQDSDAESDDVFEYSEEPPGPLTHAKEAGIEIEQLGNPAGSDEEMDFHKSEEQSRLLEHVGEARVEVEQPEVSAEKDDDSISDSNYGDIGEETQFQAIKVVDRLTSSPNEPPYTETRQQDTTLEIVTDQTQATGTQNAALETVFENKQLLETQRITSHHLQSMAPRTANSDVFISMPPQTITNILSHNKTHEMRNWALPPGVVRLWIYETKPVCAIKYMCSIGPALRPGELEDESGLGNKDFNKKSERGNWHAYEILAVYELLDLVELAVLLERGWFKQPPRTFSRVGPAVADELVSNLKPPLFASMEAEENEPELNPETSPSSQTDTQEAEAQLLGTIKQYTQSATIHSDLPSSKFIKPEPKTQQEFHNIIASSEDEAMHNEEVEEPRLSSAPSQATTVDLSQTQTPRRHHRPNYHQQQSPSLSLIEDDVILESPTRPVPSSTPARIDSTPIQLPQLRNQKSPRSGRSGAQVEVQGPESLVPYLMSSSQLLTRSQLLSDSLLQDSVPGPPPFVGDSEDEDEEL